MSTGLQGFIDLQVNGYRGIDFNSPNLSLTDFERAATELAKDGVLAAYPTVITGSLSHMCSCLNNLAKAIEQSSLVASCFKGLHIEGPFLNPQQGFIGAHPAEHALAADTHALEQLLDAALGHATILTLAPENDPDCRLIEFARRRGLVVAAGHTDASKQQLESAVEAGLSLFTHLGNGCPQQLHRHDNIITRVLSLAEKLFISVIADGHHLPVDLFQLILKVVPTEKLIVVSDATAAAGLGAGTYDLGGRQISVTEAGCAVDPDQGNFLGSAMTLRQAQQWLQEQIGISEELERRLLHENANALLAS